MNKKEMLEIMKNMQTHENDNSFSVSYRHEDKTITIAYDTSKNTVADKQTSLSTVPTSSDNRGGAE